MPQMEKRLQANFLLSLTLCLWNACFPPFMKSQWEWWAQKKSFVLLKIFPVAWRHSFIVSVSNSGCGSYHFERGRKPNKLFNHLLDQRFAIYSLKKRGVDQIWTIIYCLIYTLQFLLTTKIKHIPPQVAPGLWIQYAQQSAKSITAPNHQFIERSGRHGCTVCTLK